MGKVLHIRSIERLIHLIRGQPVMLDSDLAVLYGVKPKALMQAVKRNPKKFPDDFMFQLTWQEYRALRSQIVTLDKGRGRHRKYRPYVFTEHGAASLSGVLRSDQADEMHVLIIRAFVQMRHYLVKHRELARQLEALEKRVGSHDKEIAAIIEAIRRLMRPPEKPKRKIGY